MDESSTKDKKSWLRLRPLDDSMYPFSVGRPGRMKSKSTPCWYAHASIAFPNISPRLPKVIDRLKLLANKRGCAEPIAAQGVCGKLNAEFGEQR